VVFPSLGSGGKSDALLAREQYKNVYTLWYVGQL